MVNSCLAVGSYFESGLVETLSGGVWTASTAVLAGLNPPASAQPNGNLTAVSCPTVGFCVAAGTYTDSSGLGQGLIETWTAGATSAATTAPSTDLSPPADYDPSVTLRSLACPAPGSCVAVGSYTANDNGRVYHQGLIESLTGGVWTGSSAPQAGLNPVADANDAGLVRVSCWMTTRCVAVGTYIAPYENWQGMIDTLTNGTWSATTAPLAGLDPPAATTSPNVFFSGLSCASTTTADGACVAVASYQSSSGTQSLFESLSAGTWTSSPVPLTNLDTSPNAAPILAGVSCAIPNSCAAVGTYIDGSGTSQGLIETEYGGGLPTITISSSAKTAVTGTPVTYTATISPIPDGGTVTFDDYADAIPACASQPVNSINGQATCTVTYATSTYDTTGNFTPHKITATYSGDTYFAPGGPSLPPVWENVLPPAGGFMPSTPARILDTRYGTGGTTGPVKSGDTVPLTVLGHGGVPSSATVGAVLLNVTVTQPKAAGFVTVYPAPVGAARPTTSNLNFTGGQTVANLVVAKVGTGGQVELYNGSPGSVQMVADVAGWFTTS
jgi:hypothetical protein